MKRVFPIVRNIWIFVVCMAVLQSCLCHRKQEPQVVPRLPIISEALYDTSSVYYLDKKVFTENVSQFPIGLLSNNIQDVSLLEVLLAADNFDNITGAEVPDGIRDFAGEYFDFCCFTSPSNTDSLQTHTVKEALYLLNAENGKLPSKSIIITDYYTASLATERVNELLSDAHLDLRVVSPLQSGLDKILESLPAQDKKRTTGIGILSSQAAIETGVFNSLKNNQNFVVTQPFTFNAAPSLTSSKYPIDTKLIPAYHFIYSQDHISYSGSRYAPRSMNIYSEQNLLRYFLTHLLEQMRESANPPALSYLVLGDNSLSAHKKEIKDILDALRDYRQNGRYVYRHLISNNIVLIDPADETARNVYRLMLKDRLPAYRSTDNLIWFYPPQLQIDPVQYPLTHVCINHR